MYDICDKKKKKEKKSDNGIRSLNVSPSRLLIITTDFFPRYRQPRNCIQGVLRKLQLTEKYVSYVVKNFFISCLLDQSIVVLPVFDWKPINTCRNYAYENSKIRFTRNVGVDILLSSWCYLLKSIHGKILL